MEKRVINIPLSFSADLFKRLRETCLNYNMGFITAFEYIVQLNDIMADCKTDSEIDVSADFQLRLQELVDCITFKIELS